MNSSVHRLLRDYADKRERAKEALEDVLETLRHGWGKKIAFLDTDDGACRLELGPVLVFFRVVESVVPAVYIQYGHFDFDAEGKKHPVVDGEWNEDALEVLRDSVVPQKRSTLVHQALSEILAALEEGDARLIHGIVLLR